MSQLRLWSPQTKPIHGPVFPGTHVAAKGDIHFADGSYIEAGREGVVKDMGLYVVNVQFANHHRSHYVMCTWDMLVEVIE